MRLSLLSQAAALLITSSFAVPVPAPIPTSTHVSISHDPSPPRPFPAGRIVEVKDPSPPRPFPKYPLETRDPSAPHKVVESYGIATDPSPPRPFPKYALDGGDSLQERNALSRFPDDGEKEAADPSPPRPFPAGRVVEAEDPSSPSDNIEPRSPSPRLRNAEGAEAEANDLSLQQLFVAGHLVDVEVRELPSDPGHGGYFPPSNPPVSEPTAVSMEADRAGNTLSHRGHGGYFTRSNPSVSVPTAVSMEADRENIGMTLHRGHGGYFPLSNLTVSAPTAAATEAHRVHTGLNTTLSSIRHRNSTTALKTVEFIPISPYPFRPLRTINASASASVPTPHPYNLAPFCTATSTLHSYHHPRVTGTVTVYNTTVTSDFDVDCGGCQTLTVETINIGRLPPVSASRPTVTVAGTTTTRVPRCGPTLIL